MISPPPDTLASLIAPHLRSNPDGAAILAPGCAPLAYAALARQIAHTGHALASAGFGRGDRVAVLLPNGPETATAMLAVMCWATCVPLDPNGDAASLRHICRRLRVNALIAPQEAPTFIAQIAEDLALPLLRLAVVPGQAAGVFALHAERGRRSVAATMAEADDIAVVLHTSGTTGNPKAVPFTQRCQVAGTLRRIRHFDLRPRDCGLFVTPMFTGSGIRRSLLPPLAAGGSIVCPRQFDAERIVDWLQEFGPTFYAAAPTVHAAVVEAMGRRGGAPRHALRFVFSGSSSLPQAVQAALEGAFGVPVIETYAMTEAGTIAQNPLPPGMRKPGSVGVPVDAEVAIVDEAGDPLPAGEPGEIVVRGPQLFQGYEDDPEANRRAFFGDWFRTGDIGHFDGDGYLYVSGRVKDTINRGGLKVQPAEVDAALLRHPAVVDAATFGIEHATLGEDVVAVVVTRESLPVTAQALRDFAFTALADFKVPSSIAFVESIPRSPLGKVRRRALADQMAAALRPRFQPPRNPREAAVARLFAEVLRLDNVGIDDNFFALGGDSLSSVQVTSRACAMFECRIAASALFRRPTAAQFAAEIPCATQAVEAMAPPPIVPISRTRRTDGSLPE